MPKQIPYLNVFLSSPGDVAEERAIALKIMKRIPNRFSFKGRVALNIIAWDDLDASIPLEAKLTPQEAINKGLPKPSECDIVIVIFWSRIGTPFTDKNGQVYLSGTHWELLDALAAEHARTYIYCRKQEPTIGLRDPNREIKIDQYDRLEKFLNSDLFYKNDEILISINSYDTPADFEEVLDHQFAKIVSDILESREPDEIFHNTRKFNLDTQEIAVFETDEWDLEKSPFPGLRAFTERDADIFFGRERETAELIQQIKDSRFVAVVGASGSGKSSLVGAGLIPALRDNAIFGSKYWYIVRFTPGGNENPFETLASALIKTIPSMSYSGNSFDYPEYIRTSAEQLQLAPNSLLQTISHALVDMPERVEILLFIDQFEELFSSTTNIYVQPFAEMLATLLYSMRVRVVVTMRHDFYHTAVENPTLAELLRNRAFSLSIPKRDALRRMIEKPAQRVGLTFDNGMVETILNDTGDEPGNLALMAYALDELYKLNKKKITFTEYQTVGGVQGAIGKRAENIYSRLDNSAKPILPKVFRQLVDVNEDGIATRRRTPMAEFSKDAEIEQLIHDLIDARLLTSSGGEEAIVEVAHEAIFTVWTRLANWITQSREALLILHKVKIAAREWDENERHDDYLWSHERMKPVHDAQNVIATNLPNLVNEFLTPEYARLYDKYIMSEDAERRVIIKRLFEIGDEAIPTIIGLMPAYDSARLSQVNSRIKKYADIARPLVLGYLDSDDYELRQKASSVLIFVSSASDVYILRSLLDDKNQAIRKNALEALNRIENNPSVFSALVYATTNENNNIKINALDFVKKYKLEDDNSKYIFVAADLDSQVRKFAAKNLHDIKYLPTLAKLLNDPSDEVAIAALKSIAQFRDESVIPLIAQHINSENVQMRLEVAMTLRQIGTNKVVEYLRQLIQDTSIRVQTYALDSLQQICSPYEYTTAVENALNGMISNVSSFDPDMRYYAINDYLLDRGRPIELRQIAINYLLRFPGQRTIELISRQFGDVDIQSDIKQALLNIMDNTTFEQFIIYLNIIKDINLRKEIISELELTEQDNFLDSALIVFHKIDIHWQRYILQLLIEKPYSNKAKLNVFIKAIQSEHEPINKEVVRHLKSEVNIEFAEVITQELLTTDQQTSTTIEDLIKFVEPSIIIPLIIEYLTKTDEREASRLMNAIRHFTDSKYTEEYLRLLRHTDIKVAKKAGRILSKIDDPKLVDKLIPLMNENKTLATIVREILKQIGTEKALEAIKPWYRKLL